MSCSSNCRERKVGRCEEPIPGRSVDGETKSISGNGSLTDTQLSIHKNLLVDPKLLFIGSKIGEGAHGKVYEGRSVIFIFSIGRKRYMWSGCEFGCLGAIMKSL